MTKSELYVLNHVIDNKPMAFLESINDIPTLDFQYKLAKDRLIKTGHLQNENSFSNKGLQIMGRLKSYVEQMVEDWMR